MNFKKMRMTDKIIAILGLTLVGVLAFALIAGVIVALLQLLMDSRKESASLHSGSIEDEALSLSSMPPLVQCLVQAVEELDEENSA